MTLLHRTQLIIHHLLPKLWLTRLAGWFAVRRLGWLTRLAVRLFARFYQVDMHEAQQPDLACYPTFNDFFCRPLRRDARPIEPAGDVLVMPADGLISECGHIDQHRLLQAKGQQYSLLALLAGNASLAERVQHGEFVTTYLSPGDYHRVHMPCAAILREMIYVPGELFSVSPFTAQHIPHLFARNERVICHFDSPHGTLVQILVGATIVGSIETAWLGNITPPRDGIIKYWQWPAVGEQAISLHKGQQMGRFKLGSTVINLFAPGHVRLREQLAGSIARVGQPLAYALAHQPE